MIAVDSTTLFHKHVGPARAFGYPLVRLVAIVECGTRAPVGAVFGPDDIGELAYARRRPGRPPLLCSPCAARGSNPGPCERAARSPSGRSVRGADTVRNPAAIWARVSCLRGYQRDQGTLAQAQLAPVVALAKADEHGLRIDERVRQVDRQAA